MNGTIYRASIRRPRAVRRAVGAARFARDVFIFFAALAGVGIGAFALAIGYLNG